MFFHYILGFCKIGGIGKEKQFHHPAEISLKFINNRNELWITKFSIDNDHKMIKTRVWSTFSVIFVTV